MVMNTNTTTTKTSKIKLKNLLTNYDSRCYATGRRKTSSARVWISPGKGRIIVNQKNLAEYFSRETHQCSVLRALKTTNTLGMFDIFCTVKSGGLSGQAGAIQLGIARALDKHDNSLHTELKAAGLLTRDAREVERKKYGKHGARKSTQFSKR